MSDKIQTVHIRKDSDPIFRALQWLSDVLDSFKRPGHIAYLIMSTKDISELNKALYARVSIRNEADNKRYFELWSKFNYCPVNIVPSRVLIEGGCIAVMKENS